MELEVELGKYVTSVRGFPWFYLQKKKLGAAMGRQNPRKSGGLVSIKKPPMKFP